ncbi:MAG: peptidoglycan DD-metalloendopeptidase family protein [Pseudomonadota bacterium]
MLKSFFHKMRHKAHQWNQFWFTSRDIIIRQQNDFRTFHFKLTPSFARMVGLLLCLFVLFSVGMMIAYISQSNLLKQYTEVEFHENPVLLNNKIKDLEETKKELLAYKNEAENHLAEKLESQKLKFEKNMQNMNDLHAKNKTEYQQQKEQWLAIQKSRESAIQALKSQYNVQVERHQTLETQLSDEQLKVSHLEARNVRLAEQFEAEKLQKNDLLKYRQNFYKLASRIDASEKKLAYIVDKLNKITSTRINEKDPLKNLTYAIDDIDDLQSIQLTLVHRLSEQVEQEITNSMKVFELAELAPEIWVGKVNADIGQHGSGGTQDLIKLSANNAGRLAEHVLKLEDMIQKRTILANVMQCLPLMAPVEYYHITSRFGKRHDPISRKPAMHYGLDLGAWKGSAIYAPAPGKVVRAGRNGRYGNFIEIDHGCDIVTRYGHLSKIMVKKNDFVDFRQVIGKVGNTGRSTGTHLHYEVRIKKEPFDPLKLIKAGYYVYQG